MNIPIHFYDQIIFKAKEICYKKAFSAFHYKLKRMLPDELFSTKSAISQFLP